MSHLFFHCQYTRDFWIIFNRASLYGLRMHFNCWEEVFHYATSLSKHVRRFYFSLCAIFCWLVWKERNNRSFRGRTGMRGMVLFRTVLSSFQFYTGSSSGLEHLFQDEVVVISDSSGDEDLLDGRVVLLGWVILLFLL
jgi:hypothetical protein